MGWITSQFVTAPKLQTIKTGKMEACAYFKRNRVSKGAGQFAYEPLFKFDRSSLKSAVKDCETLCKPQELYGSNPWWSQKHDASGIVAHKFAHAIEYKITMKRLGISEGKPLSIQQVVAFEQSIGSVSKEIVESAFKRAGIEYTEENVMKHVSVYGNKNTRETLAEALSCEDSNNVVCNAIKDVTRETLTAEGLI